MCRDIFDAFEKEVLGKVDQLEVGIIHGDFNEQNILVRQMKTDPDQWEIFRYLIFANHFQDPIRRGVHIKQAGQHILENQLGEQAELSKQGGIILEQY